MWLPGVLAGATPGSRKKHRTDMMLILIIFWRIQGNWVGGGITQRSYTALGMKVTILEDCRTQEQGRANVFTIDPFFGSGESVS